jgi:hypothetical protein
VAERVVDLLEAVDVEEQHDDRRTGAPAAIQRHPQPVQEERAVGQPGERVVQRLLGEHDLGALALHPEPHRPAQHRGGQLGAAQMVLGSGPDGGDLAVLVVAVRQRDDRDVGGRGPELAQDLGRVLMCGQAHDDARRAVLEHLMRGVGDPPGVADDQAVGPDLAQQFPDRHRGLRIVLHQQHPRPVRPARLLHHLQTSMSRRLRP